MANQRGPGIKKKQKCMNCEGKGLLKKGDKVVKCQRCGGTALRQASRAAGSNNEWRPKALTISHKSDSSPAYGKTDSLAVACSFQRIHP